MDTPFTPTPPHVSLVPRESRWKEIEGQGKKASLAVVTVQSGALGSNARFCHKFQCEFHWTVGHTAVAVQPSNKQPCLATSKKQMYRTSMSDLVPPLYVLAAADRPLGLVRAFLTSYEVGLALLCVVAACYCVRPAREDNVDSTPQKLAMSFRLQPRLASHLDGRSRASELGISIVNRLNRIMAPLSESRLITCCALAWSHET